MLDQQLSKADCFVPRRGLRGGHLQTLAAHFFPRRHALPLGEARLFQVESEVQVLCHCHWQEEKHRALTVIIVHGLEGSSDAHYVLGTGSKAWAAGMNVVRMNVRTCGGTEKLAATLYRSGLSADIGAVVRTLISQDRLSGLGLIGFSMGGNQVLKLAGEWGGEAPPELRVVATISPAMDLSPSADALHARQNRLYEWNFLKGLRARLRRKAQLFPGRYDLSEIGRVRSIREWDDLITAHHWDFTSAEDYYTRASSSRVLDRIAVPTLVIHAHDDPFILLLPETRAKLLANPHIQFLETECGGHCGFMAQPDGYDGRWAERRAIAFLQQF